MHNNSSTITLLDRSLDTLRSPQWPLGKCASTTIITQTSIEKNARHSHIDHESHQDSGVSCTCCFRDAPLGIPGRHRKAQRKCDCAIWPRPHTSRDILSTRSIGCRCHQLIYMHSSTIWIIMQNGVLMQNEQKMRLLNNYTWVGA